MGTWRCRRWRPGTKWARQDVQRALVIDGDEVSLADVFRDLLGNAAKYTPKGGAVVLPVRVGADTAVGSISNTIGIDAAVPPHVSDLYMRDSRAVAFQRADWAWA